MHLHLGGNYFYSLIPPEYGRWEHLEYLAVSSNELVGAILLEIRNLTVGGCQRDCDMVALDMLYVN